MIKPETLVALKNSLRQHEGESLGGTSVGTSQFSQNNSPDISLYLKEILITKAQKYFTKQLHFQSRHKHRVLNANAKSATLLRSEVGFVVPGTNK